MYINIGIDHGYYAIKDQPTAQPPAGPTLRRTRIRLHLPHF